MAHMKHTTQMMRILGVHNSSSQEHFFQQDRQMRQQSADCNNVEATFPYFLSSVDKQCITMYKLQTNGIEPPTQPTNITYHFLST